MIKKNIFTNRNIFVNLTAFYFLSLILGAVNMGSIGSLLKIIAFLPFFWWLLTKHAIIISKPLVSVTIFLIFYSLSVFWSIDVSYSLVGMIGSVSLLFLLFSVSGYNYTINDLNILKNALIWSSRITAIVVLFFGETLSERLTFVGILNEDPNYLCSYYLFGIVNSAEKILGNKLFYKIGYLVEFVIYLILVIASGSRGGVLCVAMAILCVVYLNLFFNRKILRKFSSLLILIIVSMTLIFFLPYILPQEVLSRFYLQEIISSQGTGRYNIWHDYLQIFINSDVLRQFIGYGNSTLPTLANIKILFKNAIAHNIFIEHLIGIGIIGLFLYLFTLWQFIKVTLKQKNIFALSVLVGMIVLTFSTSFFGKAYWNILLYIICFKNLNKGCLYDKNCSPNVNI